jgi:PAS domain S-box-containing protein
MRADTFAFKDVFQVDTSSGRISLGGNRHVMFDTSAVGYMRQELLDSLGWDVTRGILERIGYQCGRRDADQLKRRYSWSTEEEWLRAGLRLHCLEGMARAELDRFEADRANGILQISGEWLDSFEAEDHLQQHGAGSRSVCWTLEGYASGYASEYFGNDAVCIETHCKAKGDAACRFEIRPVSQWGASVQAVQNMLSSTQVAERFDHCLRIISDMGCELEQTSLDAVVTTDDCGVITSCSPGAGEILGIPSSEAIGKPVGIFYQGGDREVHSILELLKKQSRIRNYLTELVTPAGKRTRISFSASAIRDRVGNFKGTIGIAHDLTEIRRLEDELASKNRFMANILRDSADAIITMDPDDIVTSWNKGAESMFGYTANEILGKSVNILVPQELREARELETIGQRFRALGAVRSHQTERITKDGRRLQVIFTRTAIKDDSGKIVGSSSVVKDVTSFRNLERQLADAEHLATMGELSAGLAHEIKNPLAGIKGAIDVIRDSIPAGDMHREILGDVLHEVNRIDNIVRDLLNYAKPRPPSNSSIDLPRMVQRIVAIARKTPKSDSISITVRQLSQIPHFTGDETQLEQVLMNLVLNAQKALASGGSIDVTLNYEEQSKTIRMEVKDDGPGITEDIRKRIFQPFFTTHTDGMGLGLATCLKNVQYHGGTIEVQSEVGHGTTFIVTVPLICHI